jgi:transcriptional regulator with XRE-family HTH domain
MKTKVIYQGIVDKSIFKQIRERINLSQEEFARLLGVTVTTLSRWEQGKHEPTLTLKQIKTLAVLFKGLGLEMTDLPEANFGELPQIVCK